MDSEKSINSFEIKKEWSPDCSWDNYYFWPFVDNFSTLLL